MHSLCTTHSRDDIPLQTPTPLCPLLAVGGCMKQQIYRNSKFIEFIEKLNHSKEQSYASAI